MRWLGREGANEKPPLSVGLFQMPGSGPCQPVPPRPDVQVETVRHWQSVTREQVEDTDAVSGVLDYARRAMLGELTPEEWVVERTRAMLNARRRRRAHRRLRRWHVAAVEAADGLARELLELHAPALDAEREWSADGSCQGCEARGEDPAPWPCATYRLVCRYVDYEVVA